MRRLFWISLSVILLVIISGCSQPAKTPGEVTLNPTPAPLPLSVSTTDEHKQLNFTVSSSAKAVNVTYNGGPDAADLLALKIRINNQDTTTIERTLLNPAPGESYVFTYIGLANPVTVNIIGTFKGAYQQTVLMYYF
jgi:hypothetical protein